MSVNYNHVESRGLQNIKRESRKMWILYIFDIIEREHAGPRTGKSYSARPRYSVQNYIWLPEKI